MTIGHTPYEEPDKSFDILTRQVTALKDVSIGFVSIHRLFRHFKRRAYPLPPLHSKAANLNGKVNNTFCCNMLQWQLVRFLGILHSKHVLRLGSPWISEAVCLLLEAKRTPWMQQQGASSIHFLHQRHYPIFSLLVQTKPCPMKLLDGLILTRYHRLRKPEVELATRVRICLKRSFEVVSLFCFFCLSWRQTMHFYPTLSVSPWLWETMRMHNRLDFTISEISWKVYIISSH